MSDRIKVLVADDVDHEDLIAEVQVDGDCVAVISQEEGELRIELDQSWVWSRGKKTIGLKEFQEAIEKAKASLLKMKKL